MSSSKRDRSALQNFCRQGFCRGFCAGPPAV